MTCCGASVSALATLPARPGLSTDQVASLDPWLLALAGLLLVIVLSFAFAWLHRHYRARRAGERPAQAPPPGSAHRRLGFQTPGESEARLLHSMAGAGFGAWSVDLVSGRSWRSPQYDRILGYAVPLPEWTLAQFLDHVVPEDRPGVEEIFARVPTSRGDVVDVSFECRIRRADGPIRWIEAQGSRETRGRSSSIMFGLVHDITERKNAEAQLRESCDRLIEKEQRLAEAQQIAQVGSWDLDLASGRLHGSDELCRILGLPPGGLPGTFPNALEVVHPDDRDAVDQAIQHARQSRQPFFFEYRILHPDGQVRLIQEQGRVIVDAQGTPTGLAGTVRDITERKNAEAQLLESRNRLIEKEHRLAEAQHIAQVGSWDYDFASRRLAGSDELCRIFGVFPDCFGGEFERLLQVIHPDDRGTVDQAIKQSVKTREPFLFEHRIIQPGGEVRLIEAQGRVMVDADGRPTGLAGTVHDITERQAAEERLHRLAHYDALTGLPNRHLFYESLAREMEVAREQGLTVALLYFDLDQFKDINDTFGHSMGDELLRQVAERLLASTRIRDTVGRLGGDEFGLVAITAKAPDDVANMAEKLIEQMQQPFMLAGHEVTVTPSIGIALGPGDSSDTETLIKFADIAMYHAKSAGRNTYCFYTVGMNERARAKMQLERDLRKALEHDEFVLHFQPEIDINSGEWTGAEALLRWNRPGHGLVLPAQFVPALEESCLIVPVGRWVIQTACQQLHHWREAGIGGVSLSVNVSARQMLLRTCPRDEDANGCDEGIVAHVDRCMRRYQVVPGTLRLELTETALMSNADKTIGQLAKLKDLGIQILVDDFGTGYSSMAYLKRFPIDTLKIDREFIRDLSSDPDDRAITRAMISLAHSLNLKVIAEGVETREQLDFLQDEHCDRAQGFYIAHPMPGPELLKLFLANSHGSGQDFSERQPSLFGRGVVRATRTLQ